MRQQLFPTINSSPDHDPTVLQRIDVAGLEPSQIHNILDTSRPVILKGVISGHGCEAWCDSLMENLGDAMVDYQIRNNNGRSSIFRSSLAEFIGGLQEWSNHDESW